MKRLLIMLLACLALVAAGCGGDDEEPAPAGGGGAATQKEDTSGSGSGAASTSDAVEIDMKNFQFAPKDQTVKVGQTVKWVNEDEAPHNVKGGPLDSKTFGKGGTFEFTPKKAETISYVCTIHPGMKATLTVTP
jgi:plastocyanin